MRPLLLVTALLVACGHAAPRPRPAPLPSFVDHPEVVACRTTPGACHGSAWRALRGEGELAGDFAAAAFLMAGCEGGHAPSCADLGELYAAGRGVPVDLGRACDLGRSASCAKVGRSPPFVAATPTAPLPPLGPAPSARPPLPADVEAYAEFAWTLFPEVQAPLGLDRAGLAATPPAPPLERALLGLVSARRMAAARACVPEVERSSPTNVIALSAVAAFTVGPDGRPARLAVRTAQVAYAAEAAAWDRCAAEVIAGWTLPLAPSAGRFWLVFPGAGPAFTPTAGVVGAPAYAVEGWRKPAPREPTCVADRVQLPYRLGGYASGPITVRFAVGADGRPGWFSVITNGIPGGVKEAIWRGVKACEWSPGADPEGKPADVWVILPFRFSAGE